jgi:hypothetical protein
LDKSKPQLHYSGRDITPQRSRNRHPADELHDVRDDIKRLQDREAELRDILIDGTSRIGVEFEAEIVEYTQRRLDTRAVIEHFGPDFLARFYRNLDYTSVRLKRRNG